MSTKSISNETRQHIIRQICDLDKRPRIVASELNMKVDTVRMIARQYRLHGKREAKGRGGPVNPSKLTDEIKKFICDTVDADCTTTLDDLKRMISQRFEVYFEIRVLFFY